MRVQQELMEKLARWRQSREGSSTPTIQSFIRTNNSFTSVKQLGINGMLML